MRDPGVAGATRDRLGRFVLPNYARLPLMPDRGEGAWLWDVEGRRYLDFACGIAVCSLGHCHPSVTAALCAQAGRLVHCSNLYEIAGQAALAEMLSETVVGLPGRAFFCNSGAEANEALVKLSRRFGKASPAADGSPRLEVITFTNSFHGRTMAGISATAQEKVKTGFEPLLEGFRHLPFNDPDALRAAVSPRTAAVLVEVVQGEGGIHVATPEFLAAIDDVCHEHDLLLMIDEVQAGLGRTGDLCAWRSVPGGERLLPDAVSWAKGMGNGFPLGAAWFSDREVATVDGAVPVSGLLGAGSHGTTFGGSPLASAVGLAVLGEIVEHRLAENAAALGRLVLRLAGAEPMPMVTTVRGLGLMIGFVLDAEAITACEAFRGDASAAAPAPFVVRRLLEAGLLAVPAAGDVVRWLPPLNVSEAEIRQAFTIMRRTLAGLAGGSPSLEPHPQALP